MELSKVVLRLLRAFGVFPYVLNGGELRYSRVGVVLVVFWVGVLTGGLFLAFRSKDLSKIARAEIWQFFLLIYVNFLVFLLKYKRFKDCVSRALTIGNEVLNVKPLRKKIRKLAAFEIIFSLFLVPACCLFTIGEVYRVVGAKALQDIRTYGNIYVGVFINIIFLNECVFCNFMFFLRECFQSINQQFLKTIHEVSNVSSMKLLSIVGSSSGIENGVTQKLRRLVKTRQRLLDLTEDVNSFFYGQLFVSSWLALLELLFNSFYAIAFSVEDLMESGSQKRKDPTNALYAFSIMLHALRFGFICYASEQITEEVSIWRPVSLRVLIVARRFCKGYKDNAILYQKCPYNFFSISASFRATHCVMNETLSRLFP